MESRIAAVAGAEIYGYQTVIPASKGAWINVPQKTFDQTYQDQDNKCGGGIYWVSIDPPRLE